MNNPRVYEVAKEIGIPANELVERLRQDGFSVNTNFNAVNAKMYEHIKMNYVGKSGSNADASGAEGKTSEKNTSESNLSDSEDAAKDGKSGVLVEKTGSNLKPKEFVVRYVKKDKPAEKEPEKETEKAEKIRENKPVEKVAEKPAEKEAAKDVEKPQKMPAGNTSPKSGERDEKSAPAVKRQEKPADEVFEKKAKKPHVRENEARKENVERPVKKSEFAPSYESQRQQRKTGGGKAFEDLSMPVERASKDKWQSKNDKHNKTQYKDFTADGEKTGGKKKKLKRSKNIIDETMRSKLENTDLNFEKKSPLKRKKRNKPITHNVERDEINEVSEDRFTVKDRMTVKEFSDIIEKPVNDVILKLMNLGVMAGINQYVDFDVMEIIAEDYGISIETAEEEVDLDIMDYDFEDDEKDLIKRAPVVTVMGHVDHGKTSLLDAIRSTNVTTSEAGGITQHIGASEVVINGQKIVFLDTPGHEAFTSLRARGVQVTDIAILVVAADDGVMPQTIEAIDHARAANVPIIVAINKIDKPGADPERVIKELSANGVLVEEWGGDVVSVKVSAKKKENIDGLLEMVLLVADMADLKANANRNAVGTVIEANLDKGRGAVATVLVQNGSLKVTDPFVCGTTYGRVRAMYDYKGRNVQIAGPSTAVEVIGMSEVAMAGDRFFGVSSDREARRIADKRALEQRVAEARRSSQKVTLEDLFTQIQSGNVKILNLIIKADVHGSIEAIKNSLSKIQSDEVKINIQHANIGAITESDIMLATASNTVILGFNVRPSAAVLDLAKKSDVEIKTYRIIYELISDVEAALTGMLAPKYVERQLGEIEVRTTFKVPGVGTVAGCYVTNGKVSRNSNVRLLREGVIVFEGKLASLKRFKDDVREVMHGYECGLGIEGFNDIKDGDIIEVYEIDEVKQTL